MPSASVDGMLGGTKPLNQLGRGIMHPPIAYTYEADTHCPDCTDKRFPRDIEAAVDSEGNPIGAVFSWDEWYNIVYGAQTLNCGDCHDELDRYEDS